MKTNIHSASVSLGGHSVASNQLFALSTTLCRHLAITYKVECYTTVKPSIPEYAPGERTFLIPCVGGK